MQEAATTAVRNDGAKIMLDCLASSMLKSGAMRSGQIIGAILNRLDHDRHEADDVSGRMAEFAEAYNKYLDLRQKWEMHHESAEKLAALLGSRILESQQERHDITESTLREAEDLRSRLELWEAIQQYLRFVREGRVGEILEFLEVVGIRTSRQAIESTIKTHNKIFKTEKRKREKFVKLREPF
jgi:hypothetical protein